jgi:hypothetical protein
VIFKRVQPQISRGGWIARGYGYLAMVLTFALMAAHSHEPFPIGLSMIVFWSILSADAIFHAFLAGRRG